MSAKAEHIYDENFLMEGTVLARYMGSDEHVVVPEGVTEIGDRAFENRRSMKCLSVPASVTKMGCMAFSGCDSLNEVHVPSVLGWFALTFDGYCSNPLSMKAALIANGQPVTHLTIPQEVHRIPSKLFKGCTSLQELVVPSYVEVIGAQSFEECTNLTKVQLHEGLQEIGDCAFSKCSGITTLQIPQGVRRVGDGAFSMCSNLMSIQLPSSIEYLGISALRRCTSLSNVVFPPLVTEAADFVLQSCTALKQVTLPPQATRIGMKSFAGCSSLSKLVIPNTVTEIQGDAFEDSSSLAQIRYDGNTLPKKLKLRTNVAFVAPCIPLDAYSGTLVNENVALAGLVLHAAEQGKELSAEVATRIQNELQNTCAALRYEAKALSYLIERNYISADDASQLATTCSKRGMAEVTAMLMELIASDLDDDLEL